MNSRGILISVVSPVYRGEKMVGELVRRVSENVRTIADDYEIILVNDASPDNSWNEILKECGNDSRVKGLNLSRNFGQHYAITAGLSYAKGEWVVVMDCDLQDRPEEIPNLYNKTLEGWDIVRAKRTERKDKYLKKLSSTIFHNIFDRMSGCKTDKAIANFGIYKKAVVDEMNKMPEYTRSFESLLRYVGFKESTIDVQHDERAEGKSTYSLQKLLKLTFDIIISNSNKPLRFAVGVGFFMSFISIMIAAYNIIAKLIGLVDVAGFTTTVFSIWFVGGLLLFVMGIIGLYIGKIFDQVKGRQLFIVRDKVNF